MINKELLGFIQKLSQTDPKTLQEKSLKLSEETGELTKAVLAFSGASGSKHKFADKQKILEEVADVMLVAMSVAYNLGFSHEQIENMLYQKSDYWAKIQSKEKNSPFPIPFELHVTVEPANLDVKSFKQACSELEVKPILLDLILPNGEVVLEEVMTSSKFFGDNSQVQEELERISSFLEEKGFVVVRKKIETAPWHPAVPSNGLGKMKEGNYFESHMDVKIPDGKEDELITIANINGTIVSHNNKKHFEGYKIYILTLRSYEGYLEEFQAKVKKIYDELISKEWEVERPNIEYSFFDSKVLNDALWSK